MATTLKVTRIGNSRGIRLPKGIIDRYGIGDEVLVEEMDDNLVLRPVRNDKKLDWEHTFKAMKASDENWDDWDVVSQESETDTSADNW